MTVILSLPVGWTVETPQGGSLRIIALPTPLPVVVLPLPSVRSVILLEAVR